ncbi:hypothetical protein GCM10022244_48290 [Streptomyces gulbargensis]|uniref:Uncharacterized protein n=1 Tax=Streptomyces gulbargensis TaxID=364901 RepID=A0ABP7N0T5_9ACTN
MARFRARGPRTGYVVVEAMPGTVLALPGEEEPRGRGGTRRGAGERWARAGRGAVTAPGGGERGGGCGR